MLKKACAFALVALIVSPFTAPFRTLESAQLPSHSLIDDNDPGSLIAPLTTEIGRLKIVPAVGVVTASHFICRPPAAFTTTSFAPTRGLCNRSMLSTILRL